jgi:uncharacterized protein (TIGR02145 family)
MRAIGYGKVTVNNIDPDIMPDFTWSPDNGAVGDTIRFDASMSRHRTNPSPVFKYSWRLEEGEGWTLPSDTPAISYRFRTIIDQQVLLKITDDRGLTNMVSKRIHLDPQNFPPTATFDISVPYGNIKSRFRLSAWNCRDDHDDVGDLLIRWDFDGDKIWDTGYSTEKLLFHTYPSAGYFNLTIEVMDSKGLTSQYSRKVLVSPWENETGLLLDTRDLQYYGTVKIGQRWWMAENLKYDYRSDLAPAYILFPTIPLNENPPDVETYGRFYYVKHAVSNRSAPLCPRGWSIPTQQEWEQLISDTHAETEPGNLILGGNSDFNGTYMGYAGYTFIKYDNVVIDTVYNFRDTFKKAWYFSSTQPENINQIGLFMVKIERDGPVLWTGWEIPDMYAPARCIKDP